MATRNIKARGELVKPTETQNELGINFRGSQFFKDKFI